MTDKHLTYLRELRPHGAAQLDHLRSIPTIAQEVSDAQADEDRAEGVKRCRTCGDAWHPEFEQPLREWIDFHSRCAPAPCDWCGTPTNTPEACFDCYHGPAGIGRAIEEGRL